MRTKTVDAYVDACGDLVTQGRGGDDDVTLRSATKAEIRESNADARHGTGTGWIATEVSLVLLRRKAPWLAGRI